MKTHVVFIWVVTPCSLTLEYQCLSGTQCLHFDGRRWRQCVPPKRRYPSTILDGVISQKTGIRILTSDYEMLSHRFIVNVV
jgi:hypothetical protein